MKLTPIQPNDLPVIQQWLSDERLSNVLKTEPPDPTKPIFPYIIRLEDGTAVGWCELFNVDRVNRKAEAGIAIPDERGTGLSLRAGKKLIQIAFGELGLHRLTLRIPESHERSIRLAKLLKFRFEGVESDALYRDGSFDNIHVYGLINEKKVM